MNMSRQKRTLLLLIMALLCSTVVFAARGVKIEEWSIPSTDRFPHDPEVRHMVATPQGDIYIACSGVGKVGVVRVEK